MTLQRRVFQLRMFSLLLGIVLASASTPPAPARRNCAEKCGNLTIPYPFGIGPGCYMDERFSITCNTSFNPHKPFLSYHDDVAEILDISLDDGTLRINSVVYPVCTNIGIANVASLNLGENAYLFFSEKRNRFTALGCGVQGTIRENNQLIGGCVSICNDGSLSGSTPSEFNRREGGCFGIECCQSMIPYGLKNFTLSVSGTISDRSNSTTCKYVFLADETWFLKMSSSFSFPFANFPEKVPVVLDWKFSENQTCSICGSNTNCSRDNGVNNSVRCYCDHGFQGNPYLPQGCIDINECEDPKLHVCTAACTNREGSYSCACPSGYKGDGRRDGSGCVKIKWVTQAIIGICAGIGFLLLSLGGFWIYKEIQRRKRIRLKQKYFKRNGGLLLQRKMASHENGVQNYKHFTSTELEIATDKYNENRILGRGGQGTVYKGMLTDGTIVAVKKSKVIDPGQLKEFINEVVILSQIDHRNVVKLLGCCLETEVPLLVYEFVPNGTLSDAIHSKNEEFPMSWEVRLLVAAEMAGAISYLHSAASVPIYHRDIKSTNILLDGKFRAKLSDFGTSRSVAVDQTHLSTQVKGTFGYFDPEYFRSSQFTEKSDVYSFGVVLVELLTGKEPVFSITPEEKVSLASYFLSSLEENRLLDILDARLVKEGEEVMEVAYLAKRCLDLDVRRRPLMKEVAITLEGIAISKGYFPTGKKRVEMDIKESNEDISGSISSSSEICYAHRSRSLMTTSYSTDVGMPPFMHNTM